MLPLALHEKSALPQPPNSQLSGFVAGVGVIFFFYCSGHRRDLHKRSHSFPTRRSSDLIADWRTLGLARIDRDLYREDYDPYARYKSDRKSTRLNSSHERLARMPSSA